MLFSDRVRFIPSVTVEPDQKIIIPSTPDHKVVSQAAEGNFIILFSICNNLFLSGEEMEGITGVRDVQGNFHRWHQEISLEPDGTEGRICINTHYRRILRPNNHIQWLVPNIRRSAVNFTVC